MKDHCINEEQTDGKPTYNRIRGPHVQGYFEKSVVQTTKRSVTNYVKMIVGTLNIRTTKLYSTTNYHICHCCLAMNMCMLIIQL